jgi:hypothetical protein
LRSLQGWGDRTNGSWDLNGEVRGTHPFAKSAKGWGTLITQGAGQIKKVGKMSGKN